MRARPLVRSSPTSHVRRAILNRRCVHVGTIETIGGVRTYIATPSQDFPKDKAVLILTDVFGLELNNNRVRTTRTFQLFSNADRLRLALNSCSLMRTRRMASRSSCLTCSMVTPLEPMLSIQGYISLIFYFCIVLSDINIKPLTVKLRPYGVVWTPRTPDHHTYNRQCHCCR